MMCSQSELYHLWAFCQRMIEDALNCKDGCFATDLMVHWMEISSEVILLNYMIYGGYLPKLKEKYEVKNGGIE